MLERRRKSERQKNVPQTNSDSNELPRDDDEENKIKIHLLIAPLERPSLVGHDLNLCPDMRESCYANAVEKKSNFVSD